MPIPEIFSHKPRRASGWESSPFAAHWLIAPAQFEDNGDLWCPTCLGEESETGELRLPYDKPDYICDDSRCTHSVGRYEAGHGTECYVCEKQISAADGAWISAEFRTRPDAAMDTDRCYSCFPKGSTLRWERYLCTACLRIEHPRIAYAAWMHNAAVVTGQRTAGAAAIFVGQMLDGLDELDLAVVVKGE